jgi:hypothetical protein
MKSCCLELVAVHLGSFLLSLRETVPLKDANAPLGPSLAGCVITTLAVAGSYPSSMHVRCPTYVRPLFQKMTWSLCRLHDGIACGPSCGCEGKCKNPFDYDETIACRHLFEKFDKEKGVCVFTKSAIAGQEVICNYTGECECLYYSN